ncbi:hypothetical protein Tco_0650567, partial [Tanacetum coccineum]
MEVVKLETIYEGKIVIHFTVEFPEFFPEQCKPLEGVLPARPSMQMTDMELDECEETTLHDVNTEKEMRMKQQEAYDDVHDDDNNVSLLSCMDPVKLLWVLTLLVIPNDSTDQLVAESLPVDTQEMQIIMMQLADVNPTKKKKKKKKLNALFNLQIIHALIMIRVVRWPR